MPEPHRAAIYYAPERADPLWQTGCAWLGRDPETDEPLPQPGIPAQLTISPSRYGFHATLKPPMRLQLGFAAFLHDAEMLAARLAPFDMPALQVSQLGRFLALTLATPSPAFQTLADRTVTELDAHRRPEDAAARAARAAGRPPRQLQNLERWGYPLLFEDWQFHMTLSDPLDDPSLRAQAQTYFEPVLNTTRQVQSICVFQEPAPGEPFRLTHRLPLGA